MKIIGIFLASWVTGLAVYLGSGALIYRQVVSGADLSALLVGSVVAYGMAFVVLYLPALFGLRRLLGGVRPLWPFPLVATLLGVVPTALIFLYWGGRARDLLSSEALLFYAMFAATGVVVGLGFIRWQCASRTHNPSPNQNAR